MKKLAAVALAAMLLTGCGHSNEWERTYDECMTYLVEEYSFAGMEDERTQTACEKHADEDLGKTVEEARSEDK